MSDVDPKLLDRLRKLQAMVERPGNEHEGHLAAARLAELMARHQVETADLVGPPLGVEDGRLDAEDDAPLSRVEHWELTLASAVAEASGGRAWFQAAAHERRRMRLRMCGPLGSTGAARYMYLWLRRQVADMSRAAARARGESNAWRRAYAVGLVTKIYQRMTAARRVVVDAASSTAIVLVDRQRQLVDERLAADGLTARRSRDLKRPNARLEGFRDGDDVDLGDADAAQLGEGHRRLKP